MFHQEEPLQSSSIYAQYKVYELAKEKGVTVILDGQGADEILAGYNQYYHWYWQELLTKRKWKQANVEVQAAKANGINNNWGWKNYIAAFMPGLASNRLQQKAWQQQKNNKFIDSNFKDHYADKVFLYKPTVDKLNDILYFNTMQSGLEDLLRYADRNSMAHSREVRLPFLNHQIVEFIFGLPAHYKIVNGFTKHVLRLGMEPLLPKNIVWRKDKVGYEPPQQQWMQQAKIVELLHESRRELIKKGILNKKVIDQPIVAGNAHQADNFDWRFLCAAQTLY
jgi:asparagine synthase (glutamine-hydrolysing)